MFVRRKLLVSTQPDKMHLMLLLLTLTQCKVWSLEEDVVTIATDYFRLKNVRYVCYLSCEGTMQNTQMVKKLMLNKSRVSVKLIDQKVCDLDMFLHQWYSDVGVLMDGRCRHSQEVLHQASMLSLFDGAHMWLVVDNIGIDNCSDDVQGELTHFQHLNLSVDADIVVITGEGGRYQLTDVFNYGKIQGNQLETRPLGTWDHEQGLSLFINGFKYYHRWNFRNLTLRAISVVRNQPSPWDPMLLWSRGHTPGVSYITKVAANLLNVIKLHHNFRFNYTIADRWVGAPDRNSTLAVTNSLLWREQDVSFTSLRITAQWLQWVEPFFPPVTKLETKFYYLVKEEGPGHYENRFLTPLSVGAWACTGAAGAAGALVLTAAAARERRPQPVAYAVAAVLAAFCQQGYEDGVPVIGECSSQSRRISLAVVGVSAMLVYNYYTSSVVSWLLSAAPPSIASVEQLAAAPLQLAFDDVGYTRGWLDSKKFYYYSGWKNLKEDPLRAKALQEPRTLPLLMPVEQGIELVRIGAIAYHAEPNEALRVISRRFSERELCELAALQMMPPGATYVMGPPRSPYRQFFVWSMSRLLERGVMSAERGRVATRGGGCGGGSPRALALGQASPALALLAGAHVLALMVLLGEILLYRSSTASRSNNATDIGHVTTLAGIA